MATINPTLTPSALLRFFPELSHKQVHTLTSFCLGTPINSIALDLNVKPESINRSLLRIIERLECGNLKELKNLFLRRVFFAVFLHLE